MDTNIAQVLQEENITSSLRLDVISTKEAFAAMRAIRTDDIKIIKTLYRERQNEKTLAI